MKIPLCSWGRISVWAVIENRHTVKMKYREAWAMILLQWCNAVPWRSRERAALVRVTSIVVFVSGVTRPTSKVWLQRGGRRRVSTPAPEGLKRCDGGYTDSSMALHHRPLPMLASVAVTVIGCSPSVVGYHVYTFDSINWEKRVAVIASC